MSAVSMKYRVNASIAEIGARGGDILVIRWPRVFLVYNEPGILGGTDETVRRLGATAPTYGPYIRRMLQKYAQVLVPLNGAPPAHTLVASFDHLGADQHVEMRASTESVQPIRANSDDGAIFELLSCVGCRMPPGGDQ